MTLATSLLPAAPALLQRLARSTLLVLGGTLALWLSAKAQIPFWPVPLTLQPLVVLAIGAAYGWRLGALTLLAYLAEGAAGLPVFAGTPEKGLGLAYMAGPTGGYLLGFVFAAAGTGWLAERGWDRRPLTTALAMLAGLALIYLPGGLWLAFGIGLGLEKAVTVGLLPFWLGDLVKIGIATAAFPALWRLVRLKG